MSSVLDKAVSAGHLREIDRQGALFLHRLAAEKYPELLLAGALVSQAVGEGHICLPLETIAGTEVFSSDIPCRAPDLENWKKQLLASGITGVDNTDYPLVLDAANRLYFARHYIAEQLIAEDLTRRSQGMLPIDAKNASCILARLFHARSNEDWQSVAVGVAALKRFVVISGGPGTGKTYTVARILALHQKLAAGKLRIELVAPTGKAAVRLQESISLARKSMDDDLADLVPTEAKTLHRLLGFHPGTGMFRYNGENQLHSDLLVIDEASMIDVEMMAALVKALPERARLIMLGDRDQLTSVEAGSLFGDICSGREPVWSADLCDRVRELAGWSPPPGSEEESFGDSVVLLKKSYRFQQDMGIARLASVVNAGKIDQLSGVTGEKFSDLRFCDPGHHNGQQWLEKHLLAGLKPCFASHSPEEALSALSRFRVLCSIRDSDYGVTGINRLAEKLLRKNGFISDGDQWYRGRPVIIRSNSYGLQLFNGDTGVVWPDSDGKLWAWFEGDGKKPRQVPLTRLPKHDTAYAITVHQAQGSEFVEVLFLLPAVESRVVSRELIYTAITRAREKLLLFADPQLLGRGIEHQVLRYSGLKEKLWEEK